MALDRAGIERAADMLNRFGFSYHWFAGQFSQGWRKLDLIGQHEFLGIVESIILAYLNEVGSEPKD